MEVIVVVVGVLVALAVQQWAEQRAARERADAARGRLREEVVGNTTNLIERIAVTPCLTARLRYLSDRLERADQDRGAITGFLAPSASGVRRIYAAPVRIAARDVLTGALNSGDLAVLPAGQVAALGAAYSAFDAFALANREEFALLAALAPLRIGVPGDGARRDALYTTVERLRGLNSVMKAVADDGVKTAAAAGFALTPAERRSMRSDTLLPLRKVYGQCVDVTISSRLPRTGV